MTDDLWIVIWISEYPSDKWIQRCANNVIFNRFFAYLCIIPSYDVTTQHNRWYWQMTMEPEKCAFLFTEQEISYSLLSYILKSQQVEHHSTFQEKFQFVKLDWSISVEVLHCSALARLRKTGSCWLFWGKSSFWK